MSSHWKDVSFDELNVGDLVKVTVSFETNKDWTPTVQEYINLTGTKTGKLKFKGETPYTSTINSGEPLGPPENMVNLTVKFQKSTIPNLRDYETGTLSSFRKRVVIPEPEPVSKPETTGYQLPDNYVDFDLGSPDFEFEPETEPAPRLRFGKSGLAQLYKDLRLVTSNTR